MLRAGVIATLAVLALAGCSGRPASAPEPSTSAPTTSAPTTSAPTTSAPTTSAPTSTVPTSSTPPRGSTPPAWLGARVLPTAADGFGVVRVTPKALRHRAWTLPDRVPRLPGTGFASRVERAPADVIARSTWVAGCPVTAADLDWVRVTFRGFDGARHTGELLVNRTAAAKVVTVFHRLWDAGFPIEQMHITTKAEAEAPPTGDGDNTSAFNCRPVRGQTSGFSQHAYGLAIDVDPFQNPYVKGDQVLPELASWYLDRDRDAPGIITAGGPVVAAFKAVGWGWGGDWHGLKDYEHFSADGR